MVLILHSRLEQKLEGHRFNTLLQPLPSDIQQKARRYRRWQDAQACLFGKLLLIEGLNRFGLDGSALIHEILYTPQGRPYLPGAIDFNISHSGNCILCAFSTRYRVGIDVEIQRPIHLPHFRNQMTDAEWKVVANSNDPNRAFLYYWTRKEAAIKAHGHGLSLPLKEVVIGEGEVFMEGKAWPLYEIRLPGDYICHLVTDVKVREEEIRVEVIPETP